MTLFTEEEKQYSSGKYRLHIWPLTLFKKVLDFNATVWFKNNLKVITTQFSAKIFVDAIGNHCYINKLSYSLYNEGIQIQQSDEHFYEAWVHVHVKGRYL